MVNLQIKGYVPPITMGYGTWEDITPSEGIIRVETDRSIDGGDSASIVLASEADFTDFEQQRAIQIFLGGDSEPDDLIWEGFILTSDLGVHSPWVNALTYEIKCVGYEKFLMRKEITRDWDGETFDTIFADLANEANADMRFPTRKIFRYDTSVLSNYDADTYTKTITKSVSHQKIYNVLKEIIPLLDGMDTLHAYEYGLRLDYHTSHLYIYLMPDMLYSTATATTDFTDESLISANSLAVKRNFNKLINFSHAIGDGFETSHYHATRLITDDYVPASNYQYITATGLPTQRAYLAIEIQNTATGMEYGSFSVDGWDAPVPGNALSEDIYFYAPQGRTTTLYTRERYGDFNGATPFLIRNMRYATINVYECEYGIAGKSINDYGICTTTPRRLDLDTQNRVDNFAQQEVRLYHKPVHEAILRVRSPNETNYINKTIDLTDPFLRATKRYLVTKQRYLVSKNYDVEQWLTAIHCDYNWE